MQIPGSAYEILDKLNSHGQQAVVVGGCVRDSLMGKVPKDWDIATSANPDEIKKIFRYTIDTGIKHGTVTVLSKGFPHEVTTFRIDGEYLDGRRPKDVTFTTDLEADLSRRDFTMNAIAYSPNFGLVDPFGGASDIEQKIIRCVGYAPDRFTEDALRMMRAIRFSAQLSFEIDAETFSAIPPLADRIKMVSIERVREELTKILVSENPNALALLMEAGLWQDDWPKIDLAKDKRGKMGKGGSSCLIAWLIKCPKEATMLYTLLAQNNVEDFLRRLKFDNKSIKEAANYSRWLWKDIPQKSYKIKIILNEIGAGHFDKLLTLREITQPHTNWEALRKCFECILQSGECYTVKDLAINGRDLIAVGVPAGEAMGNLLAKMLDAVMQDPSLNTKKNLLNFVD